MFNRKAIHLLTAAAVFAASPVAAAQTTTLPDADPAMWVVKDDDTTIYLFGTFHVHDGKTAWFNDEVKTAFDKSDEVVLEAILPENPASIGPLIQKYALAPSAKPLSTRLSPKAQATLTKLLAGMGAPAAAFDQFKPMFASMTLVAIPYQQLGLTADKGVEASLTAAAKAAGKPIGELEGFEAQLKMLDQIPEADQIAGLESFLTDYDQAPAYIRRMVTYWNSGDAEGFAALMKEMQADSPGVYKVLMTERNQRWAEWIDQRLDKPGTVFVGVGTAHLAGKDSVQQLLGSRGILSARAR